MAQMGTELKGEGAEVVCSSEEHECGGNPLKRWLLAKQSGGGEIARGSRRLRCPFVASALQTNLRRCWHHLPFATSAAHLHHRRLQTIAEQAVAAAAPG